MSSSKRFCQFTILFVLLFSLGQCALAQQSRHTESPWYIDLAVLSSPSLAGRKAGSIGAIDAAHYVQQRLTHMGYLAHIQPFEFKTGFFSQATGHNVITSNCANHCIVISAHHDHLGTKGTKVYPGVNDNASGIAAMLYLAEILKPHKERIIFAAFDAEESGLHGAHYFVTQANKESLALNINLDMLKLPKKHSRLFIFTRQQLCQSALDTLNNDAIKIQLAKSNAAINRRVNDERVDWLRASDHWAFAKQKIPFIFVTGAHDPHYHSPTDNLDNFNLERFEDTLLLLSQFTAELLTPQCSDSDAA
ncbi:M28 family peptidase [Pseudoalteromonas sp. SSDWG2]|uniref:M28 family peptidase n=1 Tax=Pseudoalteromonas sp. SSDWG2 TaxID=3139391 RepID=UPI003BACBC6C